MNLSSQKSAIALSASAAALLMPVSAFAEDGAAGADILIPKMAEFIPALIAFLIIWIVLAKVYVWNVEPSARKILLMTVR